MPRRQPTPIFVPFQDTQTMLSTVVSDLDQVIRTALNPDSAIPTDPNTPQIISNLNTMAFWGAGNRTAYDTTCQWTPMSSGHVVKMFVNIGTVMDMTAFTDNSTTWDTVTVSVTEAGTGNSLFSRVYPTGLDVFNAAGEARMFIVADPVDNQSFFVAQGVAVNIRVQCDFTETITQVFQLGVVPFFPTQPDTLSKFFSQSGIVFYVDRTERIT